MKYICLSLLVLGLIAAPEVVRAQVPPDCAGGGQAFTITEGNLIEPLNEVTACTAPFLLAGPLPLMQFDLIEPNGDPLLPVSDYLDILSNPLTGTSLITLTSDLLEVGFVTRPTATQIPEVTLSDGSEGAIIDLQTNIGTVRLTVISDGPGGEVPEPASVFLLGAGLTGLVALKRRLKR